MYKQYVSLHIVALEFFLMVLLNSLNSVTKIFVIKRIEPATSCVRDHDATTVPGRHIKETGSKN